MAVINAGDQGPAEGVSVAVMTVEGSTRGDITHFVGDVRSGKDGIARIRLMPGPYQVSVWGYRYHQQPVSIEEGKTARLEFQLMNLRRSGRINLPR